MKQMKVEKMGKGDMGTDDPKREIDMGQREEAEREGLVVVGKQLGDGGEHVSRRR
jgi:hypothetical protein